MDIFTNKEALKQGLLSIGGSYFPIQEIITIKQQHFLANTFICVKTMRTSFAIDFGENSKDNNRIVNAIVNDLNRIVNKYKKER